MAEDKKGFILYADLLTTIEKLAKSEKGKKQVGELFLTILQYVNDHNPVPSDPMVDIVFEPIKQQLKRDLRKYAKRAERAKQNGKLGGRPKTQNNPENPVGYLDNPEEPRKPDTVTDTVTVKDKVINKIPPIEEFLNYCKETLGAAYTNYEFSLKAKYEAWVEADWQDGHGNKIKRWKSKIKNTIPYLSNKPIQVTITEKRLVR